MRYLLGKGSVWQSNFVVVHNPTSCLRYQKVNEKVKEKNEKSINCEMVSFFTMKLNVKNICMLRKKRSVLIKYNCKTTQFIFTKLRKIKIYRCVFVKLLSSNARFFLKCSLTVFKNAHRSGGPK